ncbi:MAG: sulfotransferase [Planctomycetota bacterium]
MKSATTDICRELVKHPSIFVCYPKEPGFFRSELPAEKRAWYESLFEDAKAEQAVGDASTAYSKRHRWPEAAKRIQAEVPDARIIYQVRDPLDRIVSEYGWGVMDHTYRHTSLEEVILSDDANTLIETSRYLHNLEPFLDAFGPERVLVTFYEDYRVDRSAVLSQITGHLGLQSLEEAAAEEGSGGRHALPSVGRNYDRFWLS